MKHMAEYRNRKYKKVEHLNVRYLNGRSKQLLALILGGSLVFGMTGAGAYAAGMRKGEESGPAVVEAEADSADGAQEASFGEADSGSVEETVYVIAGADGSAQRIIVSDWTKNENGEDAYTRESLQKELPVDLAVSFLLDGKPVSAEELAGRSGRVTMRFDYVNRQYEDVEIGGETKRVYVPFVMLTGMVLDNERFTNVEVSNGRVVNDGERTVVAGFAMPGLQESLGLDREKLELPEYVEVTADTTDFRLETTMTLATTEVFSEMDAGGTDAFDELDESMEKLTGAMDQLTDGSCALYDGLAELLDRSADLTDGIGRLYSGAEELTAGAGTLESGANDLKSGAGELKAGAGTLKDGAEALKTGTVTLSEGASGLKDGLDQLTANNDSLNGGAGQVFDSLLKTANAQIQASGLSLPALTRDNYGQVLEGAAGALDEGTVREQALEIARQQVEAKVREQTGTVRTGVEAAVRQQVWSEVLGQAGLDQAVYQGIADGSIQTDADTQALAARIPGMVEAAMKNQEAVISEETEAKLQELIAQNMQSGEVAKQVEAAVTAAKTGAAGLSALKSQLDDYNRFYQGLLTYTSGVASAGEGAGSLVEGAGRLKEGAGSLAEGAGQLESGAGRLENGAGQLAGGAGRLAEGAGTLYAGIGTLQTGSGALIDGVEQLKDGAMQLSDGAEKLNEEGIEALVDAYDGDVKGLRDRVAAVADAAKNYRSFKDGAGSRGQSVRFLYKTERIGDE